MGFGYARIVLKVCSSDDVTSINHYKIQIEHDFLPTTFNRLISEYRFIWIIVRDVLISSYYKLNVTFNTFIDEVL